MRSDKSFKEFISSGAPLARILPVILLGAALIIIGAVFSGGEEERGEERTASEDIAELCSEIEGVGECRVSVAYNEEGSVYGVAVLCDGADNPEVKRRLVDLFSSLYGIGANRITVLKIEDKK